MRGCAAEEGGPLADALVVARPASRPARAPTGRWPPPGRARPGRETDYELLVEAIREGYLLHYGSPRIVATATADLALLAGDRLYALGLARLAQLGDLEAVTELADVISLCAGAHAAGAPELAEAVWEAGAVAVGWGPSEAHQQAQGRGACRGARGAPRRSARPRAGRARTGAGRATRSEPTARGPA